MRTLALNRQYAGVKLTDGGQKQMGGRPGTGRIAEAPAREARAACGKSPPRTMRGFRMMKTRTSGEKEKKRAATLPPG